MAQPEWEPTSEEWSEWLAHPLTNAYRVRLERMHRESLESLGGHPTFDSYCRQDGYRMALEDVMGGLDQLKKGEGDK